MKVVTKNVSDGEYELFKIKFRSRLPSTKERLEQFFLAWVEQRDRAKPCGCWFKQLDVLANPRGNGADVLFGWTCSTCRPNLIEEFATAFPEAEKLTIGHDQSGYPPPVPGFRDVPAKTVEFEDGRQVAVAPFSIAWSPVTVGQFDEFVQATGYVTSAERQEDSNTFRDHTCLSGISKRDHKHVPAACVSYLDSAAYCQWANVRLPTEAEWMAASLIDDRIFGREAAQEFLFGATGRFDRSQHRSALCNRGTEWVQGIYQRAEYEAIMEREMTPEQRKILRFQAQFGSATSEEHAIVRFGPQLIRKIGWNERPQRGFARVDSSDIMTGFRVVRL